MQNKKELSGKRSIKTYCFFSSHYLPHLGGVERFVYNISRKLVRMGNRVIVITSGLDGACPRKVQDGILVYRVPSFPLLNGRFPVLKMCGETKRLLDEIQKEPIDYMIINTRFYVLSYFAARYARARRCPAIVIEHGTGHFTVNNRVLDFFGHLYEHAITYMVRTNICDFYGVSKECNHWLEHFHIRARGVLYNAVDVRRIDGLCKERDGELESMIGYDPKDIIITYTGRLVREKGILKLIAAIRQVRRQCPNVKLCIAGDGDLYEPLKRRQTDHIILLGQVDFQRIIHLLHLSYAFCLPTDYPEGLPTSVLEAIAAKTYVITTGAGGSKEIIADGSYGTILKNNTVNHIAQSILACIKQRDQRDLCIKKAYDRVCDAFTWEKTAEKLQDIFDVLKDK